MRQANVSYHGRLTQKLLHGVSGDFTKIRKLNIEHEGRFFNAIDINDKARVAILGHKLKELFFGNASAIGKEILVENIPFIVIGVMPEASKLQHDFYDNALMIPYTAYTMLYGDKRIAYTMILPYANVDRVEFEQTLRSYFAKEYHFNKNDLEAIHIFNTNKIFQFMRWFFVGLQIFLGFCGSLTLLIGSIGVANIMFLIVAERTHEIGLRKALGATDLQILWQLLLEALIIIALGGSLGFITAVITISSLHFASFPDWMGVPKISLGVILATISVLGVVGFFAGYFPARRAARMDPVDALNF